MDSIQKIQTLVEKLSPEELTHFRDWFREYDWDIWEREIEADVAAGKLDHLIEEARVEHLANPAARRFIGGDGRPGDIARHTKRPLRRRG